MAATSRSVSESGDGDIDALLWGAKWSTGNLFFSFPTSANQYSYSGEKGQGFQQLAPELKDTVRQAFGIFSQYANLTFTETYQQHRRSADRDDEFGDRRYAGVGARLFSE